MNPTIGRKLSPLALTLAAFPFAAQTRLNAAPVAVLGTQSAAHTSSFTLDFGNLGGVSSARIAQTEFVLEVDAALGAARFAEYDQAVEPLTLPGGVSTGNIRVQVVPGSSAGTFDSLRGEFNTEELYAVHFDGDLSLYGLTSPVVLPSTSLGLVNVSARDGGDVVMEWNGTGFLPNPFDPGQFIQFSYTCSIGAAFEPQPITLVELALIPNVVNLSLPDGLENSFLTKLDSAALSLDSGNDRSAANALNAFVNKVEAQRGKKVSDADAESLVSDAEGAIAMLRGEIKSDRTTAPAGRGNSR